MRYAILLVLGLVIGIIGTVMVMNSMHRGPDFPKATMTMVDYHMDGLDKNIRDNRCAVTDNLPHLQTMRALSNDLEPVFLPVENEADFRKHASGMRAALDAAIAAPPGDCAAVHVVIGKLGPQCKACHDEFRH